MTVSVSASLGAIHHVELWVPDLERACSSIGWLLEHLVYSVFQDWEAAGRSLRLGATYIVIERSPALTSDVHERTRAGLNHLAFHAGARRDVDRLAGDAANHGWTTLFADRYPHAGGADHYATYLENADGFEVELVADSQA